MTGQKGGASALGLQRVLGLGSYRTGWSLLHKLRRAMVRPGRDRLQGVVEVDEIFIGGPRPGKRGRGAQGKALVVIAAQQAAKGIGRIRLTRVANGAARRRMGSEPPPIPERAWEGGGGALKGRRGRRGEGRRGERRSGQKKNGSAGGRGRKTLSFLGLRRAQRGLGEGSATSQRNVAFPRVDLLAIEGAVMTIDAMGCHREIALKIIDKKADTILALKGNQGTLRDDVELFAREQKAVGSRMRRSAGTRPSTATTAASRPGRSLFSMTSAGCRSTTNGRV